jgi:hypothetical protein
MWSVETFHKLGVQDVKVSIQFSAFVPPSVAPASQQGFRVMESWSSHCLLLCSSCHLGLISFDMFIIIPMTLTIKEIGKIFINYFPWVLFRKIVAR